jgi:hypothetical protein
MTLFIWINLRERFLSIVFFKKSLHSLSYGTIFWRKIAIKISSQNVQINRVMYLISKTGIDIKKVGYKLKVIQELIHPKQKKS